MAKRDESWGTVVGDALGLVPLVGRVVRDRVGEFIDESRAGLAESLREVKTDLEAELAERAAPGDGGESATAAAAPVVAAPSDGRRSSVPPADVTGALEPGAEGTSAGRRGA